MMWALGVVLVILGLWNLTLTICAGDHALRLKETERQLRQLQSPVLFNRRDQ